MAFNYEWKIVELERNASNGGVMVVHYSCKCIDSETGTFKNSVGVESFSPDASDSNFIPFESLTEEIVLSWIQDNGFKEDLESRLANHVNAIINPVIITGLPWS
jgi:hypothetical protein